MAGKWIVSGCMARESLFLRALCVWVLLVVQRGILVSSTTGKLRDGGECSWEDGDDNGTPRAPESEVHFDFVKRAKQGDILGFVVGLQRELHEVPELMYNETITSSLIQKTLTELHIPFRPRVAITGIVATVGSGNPPIVALRADMDALPIEEEADVAFKSRHPGRMHACGHDAHVAMLLGAAKILKEREEGLKGTVLLLFQPAEEGGAGAKKMIEEGALGQAEAIFGIHVLPSLATGKVASRSGPVMAGSGTFTATIHGRGGHGALPHLAIDPILPASSAVLNLQALVSRETDPIDSAVVSVTQFHAGFADNVIPDSVTISGTFRSFSKDGLLHLKQRIEDVIMAQAKVSRCNASLSFRVEQRPLYPPTINHKDAYLLARTVVSKLSADVSYGDLPPMMAAEDFSFYQEKIPGCFLFLGMRNESKGCDQFLHTPRFKVDESALPFGVAIHAALAENFLVSKSKC